jgi:hypothetical protein
MCYFEHDGAGQFFTIGRLYTHYCLVIVIWIGCWPLKFVGGFGVWTRFLDNFNIINKLEYY